MKELASQAVSPDGISFRRWQSGETIGFTDLSAEFSDVYGAPYYVAHRAHLHAAIFRCATGAGAEVRLNSRVVDYDTVVPSVTLSDGTVVRGDLVVAADGAISPTRAKLFSFLVLHSQRVNGANRGQVDSAWSDIARISRHAGVDSFRRVSRHRRCR